MHMPRARISAILTPLAAASLAACSGASASSNQATTTSSSVSATSPSLPPLSPGGQVLIEASGNHDARTGNFAARAPWYIELRYECTGENDNIVVQVAGDD